MPLTPPVLTTVPLHLILLGWRAQLDAQTGSVGCVGSPREGLAFFVSIFKSLSFCLSQVLELVTSGNI